MPYRINVPEGQEALELILNHLGTPLLVGARKRMFRIMYDAPETSLSPRERTNCLIQPGFFAASSARADRK